MKIRAIDMRLLDDLFQMGSGYVLNFSDSTFAEFFRDELEIEIDDPRYKSEGTSKAKRLRYFLKSSEPKLVVKTLLALWEYRESVRRRNKTEESFPSAQDEFFSLIERLGGTRPASRQTQPTPRPGDRRLDAAVCNSLKERLIATSLLEPQARGFSYERFLKDLFDVNGLMARASFRLVGEQIDGSFDLQGETYLLEARWRAAQAASADLWAFNGKVEEKAAWSRGLFVSDSGFTPDGLQAFGRGKRVVCMDGLDLVEMLDRRLSFSEVMARKVRRAAESGNPFVRVRDLFQ